MRVDVENGRITIDPEEVTLKNDQKLQLGFWNFKKQHNGFISNDIRNLDKVIDYLKKEKVDFNLSKTAQEHIKQTFESEKQIASKTESALHFKEGKFNKSDLSNFS